MMTKRQTNLLVERSLNHYENESFENTLRHIRETGVDVISVAGDDRSLGWTYSTGLFDTYGQPEIILTGFPPRLAQFIVNEVGRRYFGSNIIKINVRTDGLLGNAIDCIFKPVDRTWVNRLMLRTLWYYGDVEFPTLQCICPDLQNRFAWEDGFDTSWKDRQALLYHNAPRNKAETRLWNESSSEESVQ
jgi:Domain of unknown function (DUF4262)